MKSIFKWLFKRPFYLKKEFYTMIDKILYQKQSQFLLHAWHAHRCPFKSMLFYSYVGRIWFGFREFIALLSDGKIFNKSIYLDGFDDDIPSREQEGSNEKLWPHSPFTEKKQVVDDAFFLKIQKAYDSTNHYYHDRLDKTKDWEVVSEKFRHLLLDEHGHLKKDALINFRENHIFERVIGDTFEQVDRNESYRTAYLKAIDLVLEYHRSAKKVQKEILASLSESYAGNSTCVHYRGQRLSEKLLFYAMATDDIVNHVSFNQAKRNVIVDIGTGYGALPCILKHYIPNACYILTDLPEVTIFTAYYVKYHFPDAKIALFDDVLSLDMQELIERYDFVILPSKELARLQDNSVDLVLNTASLGFLSKEYVSYYMQEIDRVLCLGGYFYSINKTNTCSWGVGMYEWAFKGEYITSLLEYNNRFSYPQWLGKKVS